LEMERNQGEDVRRFSRHVYTGDGVGRPVGEIRVYRTE